MKAHGGNAMAYGFVMTAPWQFMEVRDSSLPCHDHHPTAHSGAMGLSPIPMIVLRKPIKTHRYPRQWHAVSHFGAVHC